MFFHPPRSHTIEVLNFLVNVAILVVVSRSAEYQRHYGGAKPIMLTNEINQEKPKTERTDKYEMLPKNSDKTDNGCNGTGDIIHGDTAGTANG